MHLHALVEVGHPLQFGGSAEQQSHLDSNSRCISEDVAERTNLHTLVELKHLLQVCVRQVVQCECMHFP